MFVMNTVFVLDIFFGKYERKGKPKNGVRQ